MIYILTGKVGSGKSSALKKWLEGRNDIGGFLSPDIEGKRYLQNIQTDQFIPFQTNLIEDRVTIEVGRFRFLKEAFSIASDWVLAQLSEENVNGILIDEVGKLEMKGEGFDRLVKSLLLQTDKDIYMVVRDYLLDDVIKRYKLFEFGIISKDTLETL